MSQSVRYPTNGVPVYASAALFPILAADGQLAVALDTDTLYVYDTPTVSWLAIATPGAAIAIDALLGDVTATGPGAVVATIAANAVTNAKMATMATLTIKGNNTGGASNPLDLTVAQVKTMLNLAGTNSGDVTLTAVGATPNANGASLSTQALTLQPADGSSPCVVTALAQTFGGVKTFTSAIVAPNVTASTSVRGYNVEIFPVEDRTFTIDLAAVAASTLNTLKIQMASGTCTADIQINGVSVTGLAALAITTGLQTFTATALNTIAANDKITMVISSQVGASDLAMTLKYTVTG